MSKKPDWVKGRGRGMPRSPNPASVSFPTNQSDKNKSNLGGLKTPQLPNNDRNSNNFNNKSKIYNHNKSKNNNVHNEASTSNIKVNVNHKNTNLNESNTNNNSNSILSHPETFQRAVQYHQKSAQQHLSKQHESHVAPLSSDDEDDEYENDEKRKTIISKIMGAQNEETEELQLGLGEKGGRLEELIKETMTSKANVCLVCIEAVKKNDPIWSCKECHTMLHLPCMQQWINDGSYQSSHPSLSLDHFPNQKQPWFCPKCRCSYERSDFPKVYVCFCGKVQNPPFDSWLVPHTCGQSCNKLLKPSCGHNCLLLCHPGPCPPCPKTVRASCYCGKGQPQMRRCGGSGWSCMKQCGRLLKCLKHHCTSACHPGECGDCKEESERSCLCGRNNKVLPCADEGWRCQQVCGKRLDCGFHRCPLACHSGACSPCSRLCPCGKTRYSEESCKGDVVLCSEVCGKVLSCGKHSCPNLCHTGACAPCKELERMRCRCGLKEKEVLCGRECLCDVKCSRFKDCGLHACKRKCCDGSCPPCTLACGRMLPCRQHKCQNSCHRGPCYPCSLTSTLSCHCGQTFVKVPCGAEKRLKPPKCHLLCKTPPDCRHPSRSPHHCHYGPCPKCTQTCGLKRTTCTHACSAPCHHAVEVRVKQDKRNLAGPWEVNKMAERVEVVDMECPSCAVQVPVTCLGGHETTLVECSQSQARSCHRPCNRPLTCGNHACKLDCHVVETGTKDGTTKAPSLHANLPATACEMCERPCERERPLGCTHKCLLSCHHLACPPCSQFIKMRCHCSMVVRHVVCNEWCGANPQARERLMCCSSRCPKLLSCGHPCKLVCHSGQCSRQQDCVEKVKVKCPCGRRRLDAPCNVKEQKEVKCDDICREVKHKSDLKREKEQELREAEEMRRRQEELKAFEKSNRTGRRRRKVSTAQQKDENFLHVHKNKIVISVLVLVLSILFYWLTLL